MLGPAETPAIEFKDAAAQVGGRTIWKNVSLSVPRGDFVAVLGPNGVGKTVLLKVVLGFIPLSSGDVRVLGLRPREARRRIGYLPQNRDFDPSLRIRGIDLVRLGLDGHRWGIPLPGRLDGAKRVHEVIELVGASPYATRPVGSLSGGELQRLLIAQAIVHKPDLLLLDEPLAGLDYPHQIAMVALLSRLSQEQGMTAIMVTHDVNPIIDRVQKLIYIARQGVASGPPAEVITSPILSRIYGSRVEVHYTSDGRILVVGQPEGQDPPRPDEQEHECCDRSG